ncbi:hypothetical protein K440DRAFT_642580 [Wilcoxina mikolae CBS 423.85]|nr:hypothetical protein K440DRAFT_642580 [Wilcoxina mikolae CBS 423.85]
MSSDPISPNERNFRQWAVEVEASLASNGLWKLLARIRRPELFQPVRILQSRLDNLRDEQQQGLGQIIVSIDTPLIVSIDTPLQAEYRCTKEPKALLEKIKVDFQGIIILDGKFERDILVTCRLESYSRLFEWIAAPEAIIRDLATWYIPLDDRWRVFYI